MNVSEPSVWHLRWDIANTWDLVRFVSPLGDRAVRPEVHLFLTGTEGWPSTIGKQATAGARRRWTGRPRSIYISEEAMNLHRSWRLRCPSRHREARSMLSGDQPMGPTMQHRGGRCIIGAVPSNNAADEAGVSDGSSPLSSVLGGPL